MKKLYVVGIGPGKQSGLTGEAKEALNEAEVIVGYELYIDLIKELAAGKKLLSTPMRREVERCRLAVEEALSGKTVALVCSGDAGVYGMAGVVLEIAAGEPELEIEIVPGVTAACSGAAILGAPLMHDFVVISLSDLLTPWEKIIKRIKLAAEADFVICLYNPASKKRQDYLALACEEMLKFKAAKTPCGYVQHIGRAGQVYELCSLAELKEKQLDMFTTVFIGNEQTKIINNRMLTPRGYTYE